MAIGLAAGCAEHLRPMERGASCLRALDAPFVDVLTRLEDLRRDYWEVDDDALRAVAVRSGDVVALGDRLRVEVIDAAILRRTVYAKRVGGESKDTSGGERPCAASSRDRSDGSRDQGRSAYSKAHLRVVLPEVEAGPLSPRAHQWVTGRPR
jgi:hypothetical protein